MRGSNPAPDWLLDFEYAADFGLDPDGVNPTLATFVRWQLWRTAKNSRRVWDSKKRDENWAEHFTDEQTALHNWALEDLIDEE